MQPARLLIPLLVLAAGLRADEPPAAPATEPAKRSSDVLSKMADTLPKYNPPPPAEPKRDLTPNPDVLELPKMTVKQKPRPRLNQDMVMTNAAFNQKLARDYLSSFDRDFLNKLTLPLFGASAADRAREEYERKKRDEFLADVMVLAKAAEQVDPAKAKALREEAAAKSLGDGTNKP